MLTSGGTECAAGPRPDLPKPPDFCPRRLHRGLLDIRPQQILNVSVLGRLKAAKSSFLNRLRGRRTMMRCEECDRPVRSLFMADKTGEASPE